MSVGIEVINYLKVYRLMETWVDNGYHAVLPDIAAYFNVSLLDEAVAFHWLHENGYVKFNGGGLVVCR